MKKREGVRFISVISFSILVFLAIVLILPSISAATNSTNTTAASVNKTGFDKSIECLKGLIDDKSYSSLTVEELAYSLLALGYDSARQSAIKDQLDAIKDTTNACWPSGSCDVKQTALVFMAYNHINADTKDMQNWLMNQTAASSDLVWYLQVDNPSNEEMKCTIVYDNSSKSIVVGADKKITGNAGVCLTNANDYWLEVKSSCYGKDFEISCDKDFLTSTLYRKKTDTTKLYVSALINQGSPGGKTKEKIESLCFKQGASCNYEASLWATLALNKKDSTLRDKVLPYLIALESDNTRLLPSAFLYSITGFDEYFIELTGSQNTQGYWQISDTSRRYYDTAVALLSLYQKSSGQADTAVQYLLSPSVQGEGCWGNNLRDTAFILYAAYPKPATSGGKIVQRTLCTSVENHPEYSCLARDRCEEVNGSELGNFYCIGAGDICCDRDFVEKTCSQKDGTVCLSSQECSIGGFVSASDSSYCCLGECKEPEVIIPPVNACTDSGYACKVSCASNEQEMFISCLSIGEKCCTSKPVKAWYQLWWLWLLIILIVLIALAIIFRDKVKEWWFKIKSRFSKGKGPAQFPTRPMLPPGARPMMPGPGMPRRIIPGTTPYRIPPGARVIPRKPFPREKELDETLRRLKEMSR